MTDLTGKIKKRHERLREIEVKTNALATEGDELIREALRVEGELRILTKLQAESKKKDG